MWLLPQAALMNSFLNFRIIIKDAPHLGTWFRTLLYYEWELERREEEEKSQSPGKFQTRDFKIGKPTLTTELQQYLKKRKSPTAIIY